MKAYTNAGVFANTKAQIAEFKKFEDSLRKSGVFKNMIGKPG